MNIKKFSLILLLFPVLLSSQNVLDNENIWFKGTYSAKSVPGFRFLKNGNTYIKLETKNKDFRACNQYDLVTGNLIGEMFSNENILVDNKPIVIESFQFDANEDQILISNSYEQIYRHSGKSFYYIYNLKNKNLIKVSSQKVMYATFSPDGGKVAYVLDNNLFYFDITKNKTFQITKDGQKNKIINGAVDWVYEEEFSMSRGFIWSGDSKHIAYYKFDETNVPEFSMEIYGSLYPKKETWKYPKAGEPNSKVDVFIYKVGGKKSIKCQTNSENDQYLPRIAWVNSSTLSIQRLNRHQNHLQLLFADVKTGKTNSVYEEKNKYYVEVNDFEFETSSDGKLRAFFLSEKSGNNHLHQLDIENNNSKETQLTKGAFDIDVYLGRKENIFYYTSGINITSQRQLYSFDKMNNSTSRITNEKGWHSITFSPNFDYFVDNFSTIDIPPTISLFKTNGENVRVLENNKDLNEKLKNLNLGKVNFGQFKSSEGVSLDYWQILPPNYDSTKKYPVLFFVYGGPGYQTVKNQWAGGNYFWHQTLAQKGYIIISIDNRGSGGKGEEFKKMTYLNLGKYETIDYIEAAKYFGNKSYVDKNRIGIWGWSYGGFMASNCITKGADYFKTAIAVAPVTNWRYYDNIYTERYMRTPKENPTGYDTNSPIFHINKIKGNYLIIHGNADDNVHFQNAAEMVMAMNLANVKYDAEYYPNTNHGIYGGKTRWHLYNKMTDFILKNL